MNSRQTDYYRVLGLPPTASADEIKRSYRELARRFHPDVNPSAEAAQKIKGINEAYHHLGDADRRSLYDAERLLQSEQSERPRPTPSTDRTRDASRTYPDAGAANPRRPGASSSRVDFNGFGRVHPESSGARVRPQAQSPSGFRQKPGEEPSAEIKRLITEAQLAYIMRRYRDAEKFCRQVIALDRKQATAHEILGDIYMRRGDQEKASASYSYAVQFNPRNQSAQIKLERMMGGMPYQVPSMSRRVRQPSLQRLGIGPQRDSILALVSIGVFSLLCVVMLLFCAYPGQPFLGDLSLELLLTLPITGALSGILLAFYGKMRPLSQELVLRSNTGKQFSVTGLLGVIAIVSFYASLLVYMIIIVSRKRASLSVMRAYGVTLLLTALFVCLYHTGKQEFSIETILFAGNLLFPGLLLGWRLGDVLRMGGTQ